MLKAIGYAWVVGSLLFFVYACWRTYKEGIFPKGRPHG